MNVKDLIAALQKMPAEAVVIFKDAASGRDFVVTRADFAEVTPAGAPSEVYALLTNKEE